MTRISSMTARPVGMEAGAPSTDEVGGGAPIFLVLPVPPSLNKAYANRPGKGAKGRFYTKAAEDWMREAKVEVHLQKPGKIKGPVVIVTNVERQSRMADIDNRTKLTFDLLKACGIIEDDRFVTAHATAWSPSAKHRRTNMMHVAVIPAAPLSLDFHLSDASGAVGGWTVQDPAHTEGVAYGD